jgi:hypothetical protein
MTIVIEIREGHLNGRFVRLYVTGQHGPSRGDGVC